MCNQTINLLSFEAEVLTLELLCWPFGEVNFMLSLYILLILVTYVAQDIRCIQSEYMHSGILFCLTRYSVV